MVQHSSLSKYTIDANRGWIKAQESCQYLPLEVILRKLAAMHNLNGGIWSLT